MADGVGALTDKEKQTLRLLLSGHDAKSSARALGLSVHTINERLRDARRKLAVGSSREAARLLLAHEQPDPSGDKTFGDAPPAPIAHVEVGPMTGPGRRRHVARLAIGAVAMSVLLALAALIALPQSIPADPTDPQVEAAARRFLTLVDHERWQESWAATGSAFRRLNTAARWAAASQHVRATLGTATARTLLGQEDLPAPPHGFTVVRYRTDYTRKPGAIETVTLDREGGTWRVVGVTVG